MSLRTIFDDVSLNKPESRSISELRECFAFFVFIFVYFWARKNEDYHCGWCCGGRFASPAHTPLSDTSTYHSGSHSVYFLYLVSFLFFFSLLFFVFTVVCVCVCLILAPNWFTYSTAVAVEYSECARASDKVFGVCLLAIFDSTFISACEGYKLVKITMISLRLSFVIIVFQFITKALEFCVVLSWHSMARTKLNLLWLLESVTISGNLSAVFFLNRFLITSIIGLSAQAACVNVTHLCYPFHNADNKDAPESQSVFLLSLDFMCVVINNRLTQFFNCKTLIEKLNKRTKTKHTASLTIIC